ncbi:protein of unknown function [bacterium A37T11]|nr:protein of unknown function [bacterium A37T11]
MSFSLKDKVYFDGIANTLIRDSATYSFAIKEPGILQDTFYIPLRIMGVAKDADRLVNCTLTTESESYSNIYQLLTAVIPAGSFTGYLPVKLFKDPILAQKEIKLHLTLTHSDDFDPGVTDQINYLLKVNNFLTRPASWQENFLGRFSQVKYGLIIRETGYEEFTGLQLSIFRFINQTCRNALITYQEEHGVPLLDEFGEAIVFPF